MIPLGIWYAKRSIREEYFTILKSFLPSTYQIQNFEARLAAGEITLVKTIFFQSKKITQTIATSECCEKQFDGKHVNIIDLSGTQI